MTVCTVRVLPITQSTPHECLWQVVLLPEAKILEIDYFDPVSLVESLLCGGLEQGGTFNQGYSEVTPGPS